MFGDEAATGSPAEDADQARGLLYKLGVFHHAGDESPLEGFFRRERSAQKREPSRLSHPHDALQEVSRGVVQREPYPRVAVVEARALGGKNDVGGQD
jgi:hypothetical protein